MSSVGSQLSGSKGAVLIRILVVVNFVLFFLLISPAGRNRNVYKALSDAGFAASITIAVQVWFVGATLFATVLYLWRRFKTSNVVVEQPGRGRLDGVLLLAWWIVLIVACLYAFMLGMGG